MDARESSGGLRCTPGRAAASSSGRAGLGPTGRAGLGPSGRAAASRVRRAGVARAVAAAGVAVLGVAALGGSCSAASTATDRPCAAPMYGIIDWTYDGAEGSTGCLPYADFGARYIEPRSPPWHRVVVGLSAGSEYTQHGLRVRYADPTFVCEPTLFIVNYEPTAGDRLTRFVPDVIRSTDTTSAQVSVWVHVDPSGRGCPYGSDYEGDTWIATSGELVVHEGRGSWAHGEWVDLEVRDVQFPPLRGHRLTLRRMRMRYQMGTPAPYPYPPVPDASTPPTDATLPPPRPGDAGPSTP
jgi:hypothetical protein